MTTKGIVMAETYDCTNDVRNHIRLVQFWMEKFSRQIVSRSKWHDKSKLEEPEKPIFDEFTPRLKELEFGSDEYKAALTDMGEGLKHHYRVNRHHPEHYENGVSGMTLVDIVEMVSDWMAVAQSKETYVDLDLLARRFGISEQLLDIIANTLRDEDVWNAVNGAGILGAYCPPEMRDRNVEGFERNRNG